MLKENGTQILIRCLDRLNYNGYMDVLNKELLQIYDRNDIFQRDNALCHKYRVVSSFMDNCGIICLSDWPHQSPDLNIIETLFTDLNGSVFKCRPATIEELWRTCEDKWVQIPVEKNIIFPKMCLLKFFDFTTFKHKLNITNLDSINCVHTMLDILNKK